MTDVDDFLKAHHADEVPGHGTVLGAGGFVDVRHFGVTPRFRLARHIEVAMMNDPPLAVVITQEQRDLLDSRGVTVEKALHAGTQRERLLAKDHLDENNAVFGLHAHDRVVVIVAAESTPEDEAKLERLVAARDGKT